jgi:type II secretory pathway pseudopilin PulG
MRLELRAVKVRVANWLNPRHSSQRGSTIIELLIATLIVGTVATAVAIGLTYSVKHTAEARSREVATNLTQDVLEVFQKSRNSMGWPTFYSTLTTSNRCAPSGINAIGGLLSGACNPATPAHRVTVTGLPGVNFLRDVSITKSGGSGNQMIRVEVTTSWNHNSDQERSVELVKTFREWR